MNYNFLMRKDQAFLVAFICFMLLLSVYASIPMAISQSSEPFAATGGSMETTEPPREQETKPQEETLPKTNQLKSKTSSDKESKATKTASPRTSAQGPYVKVYVDQPLGYIPFVAPGGKVTVDIMIETSGIPDGWGTPVGIVGWAMDVRVDPAVLDIDLTSPPPPPIPPPPPPAKVIGASSGYVLYEYSTYYALSDNLLTGSSNPATGYWDDIAESLAPYTSGGIGDDMTTTYPNLVTLEVESKSDTQPCIIELIDVEYVTPDGYPHPVNIVVDGYYGQLPPPHAEFTYTPSTLLVDETVTFNASASYDPDGGNVTYPSGIVSYEWDFGDEATGTGNITTHAYTGIGTYTVTLNVTDDEGLWDTESENVTVYAPPVALFNYSPTEPSLAEAITFNASASYDPDGGNVTYPSGIVSYEWDFDDGIGTDKITEHTYMEVGEYTVTLTVTDDEGTTNSTTDTVTVSGAAAAAEFDVDVDVGSIYFGGETAEFYVLTSFMGIPVNATQINATLYHSGIPPEDLSDRIENIATGLYRVPYEILGDASSGTYALVVNASFNTQKGISLNTFLISDTLTGWNALLININGTVGTIKTDVGLIEVQLDTIHATLVDVNGTVATINSTVGLIATDVSTIDATVTDIEGDVATIESRLGAIEDDIDDIMIEIGSVDGTLVTIQTSVGLIETNVTAINAKISDIDGTLVTIQTSVGLIETNVTAINAKLVSVQGDIEEGIADVSAAITDAEDNILLELGHVEVKLEDINATLTNIDGDLVTIKTDIGSIKGKITSIQDDVATIETDIGIIKAMLEEWTGVTTSSITTPAGTFDIMVLTNSTLEDPVTFSDSTLTLVVSGQTGSTGILNVKIPKQLLVGLGSSIDEFVVTINDRRVSFTYTEEGGLYAVRILYMHSTHMIQIHLSQPEASPHLWILLIIVLTVTMPAVVIAPYILKTRKKSSVKP